MRIKKEEPTDETYKCMLCNCSLPLNDEFDYLCEVCRPKPHDKPILTQFLGSSGMFYQCKECYLEFDKYVDLERHQRTCGKELSEDSSEVDWKYVNKPKYLKKHKKIIKKSFKCMYCPKKFLRKNTLNTHTKTHLILHKCKVCATTFTIKADLKTHLKSHFGGSSYLCNFCGQTFQHMSSLNVHVRLHTGEKPYTCQECGRGFIQKTSLNAHVKKHSDRKPFKCTECGKNFVFKHQLNHHVKSHTDDTPYSCKECGKSFRQKGYLYGHLRNVHNIDGQPESYGCDYCLEYFERRALLIAHLKQCLMYQCWTCKETFTTRRDRDSHQCVSKC